MTDTADLLHLAYAQMEAGNLHYARAILESLVSIDPANVEAWEACMQISESCEDLDDLGNQILQIGEFSPADRESILDYYSFLRQKLRFCSREAEAADMLTFELVDQFTYYLKSQSAPMIEASGVANVEQNVALWLDKAIGIFYLVMVAIGLKLVCSGNGFGYWIILVLAVSILISLCNVIFPVAEFEYKTHSHESGYTMICEDAVRGSMKLIL